MKTCSKCIYAAMCLPLGKLGFVRMLYLRGLPAEQLFNRLPETACGLFRPIYDVIMRGRQSTVKHPVGPFVTTWNRVADHVNSLPST